MKRAQALRKLSEDHHHGLVLARRARLAAEDGGSFTTEEMWKEIEIRFREDLEPHFQVEEKHLAPPLGALGEDRLVTRLEREHRELRVSIRKGDDRSPETLKRFGELLEAHIRFEERELFQAAQERLSEEDLRAVEAAAAGRTGSARESRRDPG
jgi:hypothetical protein